MMNLSGRGNYLSKNIVLTFTGMAHGGKDTSADIVGEEFTKQGKRVFRLAYADYVKTLCARNFGYNDANKEDYRELLQEFGTDVVREIEEDFWVRIVFTTIDMLRDLYDVFIISDARFYNELQPSPWTIGYPIFNVLVKRDMKPDLVGDQNNHSSEDLANNSPDELFHIIINNNDSLDELRKMCKNTVDFILTIEKNHEELAQLDSDEGITDIFSKMIDGMDFTNEIE